MCPLSGRWVRLHNYLPFFIVVVVVVTAAAAAAAVCCGYVCLCCYLCVIIFNNYRVFLYMCEKIIIFVYILEKKYGGLRHIIFFLVCQ